MGKYDPLGAHLRRQKAQTYDMSFRDIERVLGALLPKRAQRAEWWSSDLSLRIPNVHSRAWREAGYAAELLDTDERVRFSRIKARRTAEGT